MERIAVISDIHGNIVALKAVLKDIKERQIDKIYCLGDILLKGSSPKECLDLIKESCEVVILGNCEYYTLHPESSNSSTDKEHRIWYKNKLSNKDIEYIESLPLYKDIHLSGSLIRMFHASKDNLFYRVFPTSSINDKLKLFEDDKLSPDIVIYADIHEQYLNKLGNKTLLNTGSVGNSINLNSDGLEENNIETTQANYVILEGKLNSKKHSSIGIQFIKVPYNIEEELTLAKINKIPDYEKYEIELLKGKYRKEIKI